MPCWYKSMMQKAIFIAGMLLIALALLWLFVWKFLPIGINDAEWGHISRTGLPSDSGAGLFWSEWHTNGIEEITPFPTQTNVAPDHPVSAYRIGKGENQFLAFGFYQATCILDDGREVIVPAYGPQSWTRMKWRWPLSVLALGGVMVCAGILMKRMRQTARKERSINLIE